VVDTDGSVIDAIEWGARRYGQEPVVQRRHAEFIGTEKQDGTDREQREDARRVYYRLLQASGVQGATALWQRIHNAYGQTLRLARDAGARVWHALTDDLDLGFVGSVKKALGYLPPVSEKLPPK
jgi:hypothetical protein